MSRRRSRVLRFRKVKYANSSRPAALSGIGGAPILPGHLILLSGYPGPWTSSRGTDSRTPHANHRSAKLQGKTYRAGLCLHMHAKPPAPWHITRKKLKVKNENANKINEKRRSPRKSTRKASEYCENYYLTKPFFWRFCAPHNRAPRVIVNVS